MPGQTRSRLCTTMLAALASLAFGPSLVTAGDHGDSGAGPSGLVVDPDLIFVDGFDAITIAPRLVDFGSVPNGMSSTATTFTITNVGQAIATTPSVTVSGTDASSFVKSNDTCSSDLLPGEACTVDVTFSPLAVGPLSASLDASYSTGWASAMLSGTEPVLYVLTVDKSGSGTGIVTSNPPSISCGANCTAYFPAGTHVTLSAAADAGSTFTGWSGFCTGIGLCSFDINSPVTVSATFDSL